MKFGDRGEGLSVSRGRRGSRENRGNPKGGDKSKYNWFNCQKIVHFKSYCPELGYNGNFGKFAVALEVYEDAWWCLVGRRMKIDHSMVEEVMAKTYETTLKE